MHHLRARLPLSVLPLSWLMLAMIEVACGDSGSNSLSPADNAATVDAGGQDGAADERQPDGSSGGPTEAERIAAATATANTNPACSTSALPEGFYWEIGDRANARASGTVLGSNTPSASKTIAIASSSKWIYSTYVLQKVGSLRASDVPFLHFTSGYVFPPSSAAKEVLCGPSETVGECAAAAVKDPDAVDNFFYSAGHFQHHAANVMGLASMNAGNLTAEITAQVGSFDFAYLQTNLAGGLNASASGYAGFLRRMLRGEYVMSSLLDTEKVCGSSACAAGAVLSPAPKDEAWQYSLGHWIEADPVVGDGAFSSAGALGFYPWVDATKTWYGVLARRAATPGGNQGVQSLRCGRMIRQAWVTGVTATAPTPTRPRPAQP